MNLNGKAAIVTGAGRGIGKQIALDLAEEGCNILVCSRSESELGDVQTKVLEKGVDCVILPADLSKMENVNKVADSTIEAFGAVDILVNNAGVLYQDGVLNVTEQQWDFTMAVNLKAAFFLAQRVLAQMAKQKSGYIINMVSTAAICVPPGITSYGTSKAGLIGATQALYEEAKQHGVKVSMVYPGMTDTKMLRAAGTGTTPDQWMLPQDISNCVRFLLKTSERMVVKEMVPWSTRYDQI